MMKATRMLVASCVGLALSGCLAARRIDSVIAHDTYNSYKVQTESVYFAPFAQWVEWQVWNCYRGPATFHCKQVKYDESRAGYRPKGPMAVPVAAPPLPATVEEPAPAEPPSVPAPTETTPVDDSGGTAPGPAAPAASPPVDESTLGGPGESCRYEADCKSALQCRNKICATPVSETQLGSPGESCRTAADCKNGLQCRGGQCAR